MTYSYWNTFVDNWRNGVINGWTNPDLTPVLLNDPAVPGDLSSGYIPEPWWGNDGNSQLYSVVINFNPGCGAPNQRKSSVLMNGFVNYSDFVAKNSLPKTSNWHKNKRALPVLRALEDIGAINKPFGLENHLSIELAPWHTKDTANGYWKYVKENIQAVHDYSLAFAAQESKRIACKTLNSVVLLKMSGANTMKLLKELKRINVKSTIISQGTSEEHFVKFTLSTFPDVSFVSIWGPTDRNDFPKKKGTLEAILKQI